MTYTIRPPARYPDLPPLDVASVRAWHNGQAARASTFQDLTDALAHLMLLRRPGDGATLDKIVISASATETWSEPVWQLQYSRSVQAVFEIAGEATITITVGANEAKAMTPAAGGSGLDGDNTTRVVLEVDISGGDSFAQTGYVVAEVEIVAAATDDVHVHGRSFRTISSGEVER